MILAGLCREWVEEGGAGRARRSGVVVDVFADEERVFDGGDDDEDDVVLWLRTTVRVALTQRHHSLLVHHIHLPTHAYLYKLLSVFLAFFTRQVRYLSKLDPQSL